MKYCLILLNIVAVLGSNYYGGQPKNLGQFSSFNHGVSSGDVWVLNERQILVKSFNYDGLAPDAFWYVGTTDKVKIQSPPYGKIPDENGSSAQPGAYVNKNLVLTLPSGISIHNLKWLSYYCIDETENFGEVFFPKTLNVPKYSSRGSQVRASKLRKQSSW